jgi:DNA-binding Xre family transcriptional regulator
VTARKSGYRWHLRRLMADKDMYATTELGPLLAERGVKLSREQVYRLVTGVPERLSLATLAALCDILGCGPGDLVEPVTVSAVPAKPGSGARDSPPPRPVRARVAGAAGGLRSWPAVRPATRWPRAAAHPAAGTG